MSLLLLVATRWHKRGLYLGQNPILAMGPPTYAKLIKWEDDLPQHNLDLPYPEGKSGRYVKFSNQIKMLGWNNVFNEV